MIKPTIAALTLCVASLTACSDGNIDTNQATGGGNEGIESGGTGTIEDAPAVSLIDPDGNIIGEVKAGDSAEGAVLMISAKGLPAGAHGVHIHDVGQCQGPKFESAGSHWNPDGKQHGLQNAQGPHRGDLPNLTVGPDGNLEATLTVQGSNLKGSRAYGFSNQIIDDNGAALVIHTNADDMQTDPSGNSGDRIACAVLGEARQPAG